MNADVPEPPRLPCAYWSRMRPFPVVALRAFHLLGDEHAGPRELVAAISPDPVFVANLLQCANSSLAGVTHRIATVRHAIVVLGHNRLRGLILTAALRSLKGGPDWTPACQDWWRHSVASALLTEGLASATSLHWPAAYSAGLLHDIGRLAVLAAPQPDKTKGYLDAIENGAWPPTAVERLIFGETHTTIGSRLLAEWGFPEELVEAAARHHDADGPQLVAAGCRLATAMGFAVFPEHVAEQPHQVLSSFDAAAEAGLASLPESVIDALRERIESFESLPQAG